MPLIKKGISEGITRTKPSQIKGLCLVKHESNYKYDAVGTNSNGSKDYGIFQMNSNYFCGRPSGTSSFTCCRVNTYGCADTCNSFTNSDISNDANCAVRVKNCGGFGKWYGWRDHCSNIQGSEYENHPGSDQNNKTDTESPDKNTLKRKQPKSPTTSSETPSKRHRQNSGHRVVFDPKLQHGRPSLLAEVPATYAISEIHDLASHFLIENDILLNEWTSSIELIGTRDVTTEASWPVSSFY
ncbi:LYZ [Mytilus coruscus]|uniref:lysozyme n=1 Tax=Mytilus coruscus TaxID=42192 RepID=A0A6J8C3K5_MYTCO|nr:LYZ [Mytilus coruscus]